MHANFVLRLLALQHNLRSMPLNVGEIPICLLAQRGKRCTIQDMQAVTQDNFCSGSSGAEAASGSSSNQVGSSSGSSSNQAGSSPEREIMADDDYDEHNGFDGYADDDDLFDDDYNDNRDGQSDDDLYGEQQQGNDATAEGDDDDDDDHNHSVTKDQEASDASPVVCNRLQDFQSLVDHAQFEWQKEQIEGHIRSNSLVFNTFIFLQVTGRSVFA